MLYLKASAIGLPSFSLPWTDIAQPHAEELLQHYANFDQRFILLSQLHFASLQLLASSAFSWAFSCCKRKIRTFFWSRRVCASFRSVCSCITSSCTASMSASLASLCFNSSRAASSAPAYARICTRHVPSVVTQYILLPFLHRHRLAVV